MIKILYSSNCYSCKKAINFFTENNIEVIKVNLTKSKLNEALFKDILSLTLNGFEDIISPRSKYIINNKIDINSLHTNEVVRLVIERPNILRRPIIVQYNRSNKPYRLLVGYNSEDILIFLRASN